ncbi:hypothetical protein CBL_09501 [Carabus blaptoides fortunei]
MSKDCAGPTSTNPPAIGQLSSLLRTVPRETPHAGQPCYNKGGRKVESTNDGHVNPKDRLGLSVYAYVWMCVQACVFGVGSFRKGKFLLWSLINANKELVIGVP